MATPLAGSTPCFNPASSKLLQFIMNKYSRRHATSRLAHRHTAASVRSGTPRLPSSPMLFMLVRHLVAFDFTLPSQYRFLKAFRSSAQQPHEAAHLSCTPQTGIADRDVRVGTGAPSDGVSSVVQVSKMRVSAYLLYSEQCPVDVSGCGQIPGMDRGEYSRWAAASRAGESARSECEGKERMGGLPWCRAGTSSQR